MSAEVGTLLARYARLLLVGGLLVGFAALALDLRWLDQPAAVILLTIMVLALRSAPLRLSKYSYLTQVGIPVLVGAVRVGPTPVVLALYFGVLGADVVWLRKLPRAVAEEVRDLAAQSLRAAREARLLLEEIGTQVGSVSEQMEGGREAVAGVEELSADAAQALDAIVGTTSEAGRHAHAIAATAAEQLGAVGGLSEQFDRVAEGSARTRIEIDDLARRAEGTAAGQAELERAIHQLGEVAADLQRVARHFAVET